MALTRSQILANVESTIANNASGSIKAFHVRTNVKDLANSALMAEDVGTGAYITAGNSATRNVGTTANTVAAGDDSRIIKSIQKDGTDEFLTGNYRVSRYDYGNLGSSTITLNPANGLAGLITRTSGSGTIAAPTANGTYSMIIDIVGSSSTGTPTLSGFDRTEGEDLPGSGQKGILFVTVTPSSKLAVYRDTT